MANNGLTPTRIVNKNGVETTVHKRTGSTSGTRLSSIPKPVTAPAEDKATLSIDLDIHTALREVGMNPKVRSKILATLHPETIGRLAPLTLDSTDTGFLSPYKRILKNSIAQKNFSQLNNFALAIAEEGYPGKARNESMMYALAGVRYYAPSRDPIADFAMNPDDEKVQQSKAIFRALLDADSGTVQIGVSRNNSEMSTVFKDIRIVLFVKQNFAKIDVILPLLKSGRKFDAALYQEAIADGLSPALIEGTL